jgi:hypothetical protein
MPKLVQTEFDIDKLVDQRRLLDLIHFRDVDRKGVGKTLLKSVLNRIGSMREHCESQITVARALDVTRETVGLAIRVLNRLDLITVELKMNQRYGRVLNHHRPNWNEIKRCVDRQAIVVLAPTDESFSRDRCEILPMTDERFSPDRCEILPPTDERIHPTVINRNVKTTTTDAESVVVASLKALGVGLAEKAIAEGLSKGLAIEYFQATIRHYQSLPIADRNPGKLKNWIANGDCPLKVISEETNMRIESERLKKARDEERFRMKESNRARYYQMSDDEIDAELDRRMKLSAAPRSTAGVGTNNQLVTTGT